ncbi:unnamed protein product, partial [Rotaria magnacalcarata]
KLVNNSNDDDGGFNDSTASNRQTNKRLSTNEYENNKKLKQTKHTLNNDYSNRPTFIHTFQILLIVS